MSLAPAPAPNPSPAPPRAARATAALALGVAAALALGAGCYRSSGSAPGGGSSPAPAPAGPAPRVGWRAAFELARLPAVTADGSAALLGIRDEDGARGNPNLRLVLVDRAGAELARSVVLTVDEAEELVTADGPAPALVQRIAAANEWLAAQHAARGLVPMAVLDVEPGEQVASASRATGAGATVEWRDSRLVISRGAERVHERATPATWLVEDRPMMPGSPDTCRNPAFLGGAAVDLDRRLAIITISYGGTDLCWEPSSAHHVIAW